MSFSLFLLDRFLEEVSKYLWNSIEKIIRKASSKEKKESGERKIIRFWGSWDLLTQLLNFWIEWEICLLTEFGDPSFSRGKLEVNSPLTLMPESWSCIVVFKEYRHLKLEGTSSVLSYSLLLAGSLHWEFCRMSHQSR